MQDLVWMKPLIQQISCFKNGDCIRLPQILQLFDRLGTDQQELDLASVEDRKRILEWLEDKFRKA